MKKKIDELFDIELIPVSLGVLLSKTNNPGPANILAKRKYCLQDLCMLSSVYNIDFKPPVINPFNNLTLLRFLHCIPHNKRFHYAVTFARYCWQKQHLMTNEAEIIAILEQENLTEYSNIDELIRHNNARKLLKESTAKALEDDVFGVPTIRYKGLNFWGCDRLDLLLEFHKNEDIFDQEKHKELLQVEARLS